MQQAVERIRAATRDLHEALESSSYARDALSGGLDVARYVSFLRSVHHLHEALEQAIELSVGPPIRAALGRPGEARIRLESDLAALRADDAELDGAILGAYVLGQRIRLDGLRAPARLLGHAYVLEGAQLGGLVQHEALAKRPELQHALRYLAGNGRSARASFEQFLGRLEAALADEQAIEQAILGATAAFEGFGAILRALEPSSPSWRAPVTALNADAGTHAIPSDLREVAAAIRAGEASYRRFSYYAARYGERGLAFTRSDSAWLATLACEEPTQVLRHVRWLARVLASRGMPRRLLELHLELLRAELSRAVPERARGYAPLDEAAQSLRDERLEALPDALAAPLVERFSRALEDEQGIAPEEAATLAVAAVADERRGIASAVSSLTSWLGDAGRFSPEWCQRLTTLVRAARAS